jgi:hypothetical protein
VDGSDERDMGSFRKIDPNRRMLVNGHKTRGVFEDYVPCIAGVKIYSEVEPGCNLRPMEVKLFFSIAGGW